MNVNWHEDNEEEVLERLRRDANVSTQLVNTISDHSGMPKVPTFPKTTPAPATLTPAPPPFTGTDAEMADGFAKPKRTTNISAIIRKQATSDVPTSNKFQPLSRSEAPKSSTKQDTVPKEAMMPPLVLRGKPNDHGELVDNIMAIVKKGFTIKYAPKTTLIYIKDEAEYRAYAASLRANDVEYHTYTPKTSKTHAFVLKGLSQGTREEEIKAEVEEQGIAVKEIYKMKTRFDPMYLLITDSDTVERELNSKVRYISHTRVRWERKTDNRLLTQCRRCQAWGHATSNCHLPIKCMKCAEAHWTRECAKSRDTPAKCANCGGAHTSCNTECPVYKKMTQGTERRRQTEEQPPPRYVPAPPPRENVWERRKQAAAAGTTTTTTTTETTGPRTTGNGTNFTDAVKAMTDLNKMINLSETVRALTRLTHLLKDAKSSLDKLVIFQNFVDAELKNYQI